MGKTIQSESLPVRDTDWTDFVTFSQVDPALGIGSIGLSLTANLFSNVYVENFGPGAAKFSSTDQGTAVLERPDGSALLIAAPSTTVTAALTAFDGTLDWGGTSGAAMLGLNGSATASISYAAGQPASPDAGLLIGQGTVTLPVVASARVHATGPGNMVAFFQSQIGTVVSAEAVTQTGADNGGTGGTVIASPVIPAAPVDGSLHTIVQHLTVDTEITGSDSKLVINGFDRTLGDLRSVQITLNVTSASNVGAENNDPSASDVTITQDATVALIQAGGTVLVAGTASATTSRALAAYDGVEDFAGPSGISVTGIAATGSNGTALSDPATLAAFTGKGRITLSALRSGITTIDGPGNLLASSTQLAGGTVDVTYAYKTAEIGLVQPDDIDFTDVGTGLSGSDSTTAYTGPVSYLQRQYIWSGSDPVAIAAKMPNVFLTGGDGDDALQVVGGSNVLDGGRGSSFLVGATGEDGGHDVFFADARQGQSAWNTIVNFHLGDEATLFGFQAGSSFLSSVPSDGAVGYQGMTIKAGVDGITTSITFAGISQAIADAHFTTTTGTLSDGTGYLLVRYD